MPDNERIGLGTPPATERSTFSYRALPLMFAVPWLAIACSRGDGMQPDQNDPTAPARGPAAASEEAAAARCAEALDAFATYYDDARREYVVVAPAGAKSATSATPTGTCESGLRIEFSLLTRALVAEIQREVTARDFHPEARKYTYATWLNPRSGRMLIHSDAPTRVLAPLTNKYGSLVEFQEGGVVLQ
jgi:hypothetical protein